MHIAICDDNVADRKQLERLLKRESDKRAATSGILYTDSYGSADTLLNNPMQYDVFYIDVCKTVGVSGLSIAEKLREMGVKAPIVMCCLDVDYRNQQFPEGTYFIDKPIKVSELSKSLDHALSIKEKAVPLIELRTREQTCYVTEQDILYAQAAGRYTTVTLTDNRKIEINSSIENFYAEIENNPAFVAPNAKTVINCRYVKKISFRTAIMTDNTEFKLSVGSLAYVKKTLAQAAQSQCQ